MRVLIFSTAYYPFVGGAEVAIKEITDRISAIEFDMITARFDSKLPHFERIGHVNVYRLGLGIPWFDKWWLMKFGGWFGWWLNRRNKYDVSWSMMASWAGLAGWWFKVLCSNVPLVLTLQEGDDISTRKFGLVSLGWRLVLSNLNQLTVISNYLGGLAKEYGYRGSMDLVPNGVDVEKFSRKYPESAGIRKQLVDNGAKYILIHTGRLVEKNGLEYVIRALKLLSNEVHFISVGRGDLLVQLKNLALDLGVSERVHFVDYVDHDKLPAYLQASDIFIRPSLSEGMGNSFIEAMAAGLPVIATNVGGIPDFLKDGETGLFCSLKNAESIASQVERLINNPKLKEKIILGGNDMSQKYNWSFIAEKMSQVMTHAKIN